PPVSESAGGQFDEFRITVEQLLEIDDCKCLLITGPRESGLTWTLLYILAMARLDDCEGHYVDCATVPVGITRPFSTITRSERRARMVVAVDNLDSLSPRRRRKFLEDISSVPDSLFLMSV